MFVLIFRASLRFNFYLISLFNFSFVNNFLIYCQYPHGNNLNIWKIEKYFILKLYLKRKDFMFIFYFEIFFYFVFIFINLVYKYIRISFLNIFENCRIHIDLS